MNLEHLFLVRYRIARIGESDWLQWWNSNALSAAGQYVVPRIFRRTGRLSAAHLAIGAARARHDAAVPKAPLVHLFNFGDEFEGEFERWLIRRKADSWEPPVLPAPTDGARQSGASALASVELQAEGDGAEALMPTDGTLVVGAVTRAGLHAEGRLARAANQLARAYARLERGAFSPPVLRLDV